VAVAQAEAIVAVNRRWLIREASPVKRCVEPISRTVAGKDPAGAVAAVCGRRQATDQQAGPYSAEARQRPAPILLIAIGSAFVARYLFAPSNQARTFTTLDNALVQLSQTCAGHC